MTFRVIKIDESVRRDHPYLTTADECFCLGEYQPRAGYDAGPVNQLLINYKKSVTRRGRAEYQYKENAIQQVARLVKKALSTAALPTITAIPVPPSKARTDPLYDDRLLRSLQAVDASLDVRELLVTKTSMRAHHEYAQGERRPTPEELYENLDMDEALLQPDVKPRILLFDDLLTNGTHFKACKKLLEERLPNREIIGLFIGRVKRPDAAADFSALSDDL